MKLRYQDKLHTPSLMIIEWQPCPRAARLLLTGPSFQPPGFNLGVYSPFSLQHILDQLLSQRSHPKYSWTRTPQIYEPLYTFTKPTRYAPRQGPETRLAIHAEKWCDFGTRIPCFPPRTTTMHMQGERSPWRWLGRYPFSALCEFLRTGIQIGSHNQATQST